MIPKDVRTRQDLADFIHTLSEDADRNGSEWAYSDLPSYLGILAALVARGAEQGLSPEKELTYADWAEIFEISKYME
jgi:hypothetical protein